MTQGENYYCDCANLDFYGKHCEIRKTFKMIYLDILSSKVMMKDTILHFDGNMKTQNQTNDFSSIQQLITFGLIHLC